MDVTDTFIQSIELKKHKGLVILCELNQNLFGEPINRQDLYGIELARELRIKGLICPILFVSFLSRQQITSDSINSIVNTIGHSFLQLPCSPVEWDKALNLINWLDPLELLDIQENYCDKHGIAHFALHAINSNIPEASVLHTKLEKTVEDICRLYNHDKKDIITGLEKIFEKNEKDVGLNAVKFIKQTCEKIIEDQGGGTQSIEMAKFKWKVLFLDDDIHDNHPLVKELESRNIGVIQSKSVQQAKEKWDLDTDYHPEIMVIVVDYHLRDDDGIMQRDQGYKFITDSLSKIRRPVKIIAYSSMKRNFLFRSLKYYGLRADVFSKIDFPVSDRKKVNYVCDEIIRLGDKNYEALINLPDAAGWESLKQSYIKYINSPYYIAFEKQISSKANVELDYYNKHKELSLGSYKSLGNRYTQVTKKMISSDGTAITVMDDKRDQEKFQKFYLARRLAIGLSVNHGLSRQEIANLLSGKDVTDNYSKQILANLGLKLTEYPFGLTIDEHSWLQHDQGMDIDKSLTLYWACISEVKYLIKHVFCESEFLQIMLTRNGKIKSLKYGEEIVYFGDDYLPYIRSISDIKTIINKINTSISINDEDYEVELKSFVTLIIQIMTSTKDNSLKAFRGLNSFLSRLTSEEEVYVHELAPLANQTREKEYYMLYEPWRMYKNQFSIMHEDSPSMNEIKENCILAYEQGAFNREFEISQSNEKFQKTSIPRYPYRMIYSSSRSYVNETDNDNILWSKQNMCIYLSINTIKSSINEYIQNIYTSGSENPSTDVENVSEVQVQMPATGPTSENKSIKDAFIATRSDDNSTTREVNSRIERLKQLFNEYGPIESEHISSLDHIDVDISAIESFFPSEDLKDTSRYIIINQSDVKNYSENNQQLIQDRCQLKYLDLGVFELTNETHN